MVVQGSTILSERIQVPPATYRSAALRSLLRVQWFIHLRWVAVVASFVLITVDLLLHDAEDRPIELLAIVAVLALINVCWMAWSKRLLAASRATTADEDEDEDAVAEDSLLHRQVVRFANAQIATDLLLLTMVLHYYGTVGNPMVMFYVFHTAIASLLLRPRTALLHGLWSVLLYGATLAGEYFGLLSGPCTLFAGEQFADLHAGGELVIKTYAVVFIGVFATWYVTTQVAVVLDAREQSIRTRDQALRLSMRQIEELHLRRARFMRTAAHQLKSPLTGIQTLANMIRDGIVDATGAQALIEKIIRRCRDAIRNVEELLTLARIKESPNERHVEARTDLWATLSTVVDRLQPIVEAKRISLDMRLNPGSSGGDVRLLVQVDSRDLEDCLANLVDNAVKYTPEAGHVKVVCGRNGDQAQVLVRDSGPGIEQDMLATIFDEFRRGNHALAAGITGSGLGLSIVREIVEQAGGTASVRSPINESDADHPGTEFEIRVPLCPASRAQEKT